MKGLSPFQSTHHPTIKLITKLSSFLSDKLPPSKGFPKSFGDPSQTGSCEFLKNKLGLFDVNSDFIDLSCL